MPPPLLAVLRLMQLLSPANYAWTLSGQLRFRPIRRRPMDGHRSAASGLRCPRGDAHGWSEVPEYSFVCLSSFLMEERIRAAHFGSGSADDSHKCS